MKKASRDAGIFIGLVATIGVYSSIPSSPSDGPVEMNGCRLDIQKELVERKVGNHRREWHYGDLECREYSNHVVAEYSGGWLVGMSGTKLTCNGRVLLELGDSSSVVRLKMGEPEVDESNHWNYSMTYLDRSGPGACWHKDPAGLKIHFTPDAKVSAIELFMPRYSPCP